MHPYNHRFPLVALALTAVIVCSASCDAQAGGRSGLCGAAAPDHVHPPYVAVLSAFPAELAPLVAATEIETTVDIAGRPHYVGRLGGVSVVLGLMGIGMVNAEASTHSLIETLRIAALLVSGVAGSPHRIGDVVIANRWMERGGNRVFRANRALLALARRAATNRLPPLENCTRVPPTSPDAAVVCLLHDPTVIRHGLGLSGDPFGDAALACQPGAGAVFGCELPVVAGVAESRRPPDLEDMETAAVARVAARHRVPFLAIRAVSDGAGDPLGDRDFPAQFFDYYQLAAENAGLVAGAVITELGRLTRKASGRRVCRLLAKRRWNRAARRIRGLRSPP